VHGPAPSPGMSRIQGASHGNPGIGRKSPSPERFLDYTPTTTSSMGDVYSARTTEIKGKDRDKRDSQPTTEREKTAIKLGEWMRRTTRSEDPGVPPVSGLAICATPDRGPNRKNRDRNRRTVQATQGGAPQGIRTPDWARFCMPWLILSLFPEGGPPNPEFDFALVLAGLCMLSCNRILPKDEDEPQIILVKIT
jgi:hypothetical protein